MTVVHCLKGDAAVVAVEVAILNEIANGFDNLGEMSAGCGNAGRAIGNEIIVIITESLPGCSNLLHERGLLKTCFQHW